MASPKVVDPGTGEMLQVGTDAVRVIVDSAATGGACSVFEVISPPRSGPPLHRHVHEHETFYVLEGRAKFSIDGREIIVGVGGSVFAPIGSVHTFANAGSTVCRLLVVCTPGGLEGPFRAVHALGNSATPERMGSAFAAGGVHLVGPPLSV